MTQDLSAHARLLLDYATQAAKRHHHAMVLPIDVGLAVAGRDRERADREWGDMVGRLERVAAQMTSGDATPAVDAETVRLLARVANPGDEWAVLKEELPNVLDPNRAPSNDAVTPPPPEPTPTPSGVPPTARMPTTALDQFLNEMRPLVAGLPGPIGQPTGIAWSTADPAEQVVLDELWAVFHWFASADGAWDEEELSLLREFFGSRAATLPEPAQVAAVDPSSSPTFSALHAADQASGEHHAERFARGVIRVAQSICSVDHEVGMEEARGLDRLRVQFRDILVAQPGYEAAPALVGNEATHGALEELDRLVGLDTVKGEILAFTQLTQINRMRLERGQVASLPTLHMAFLGNPGTGKTTVARLLGQILGGLGVLSQGQFIEVDRSDLIAKYVGHTAPKVHELIGRARGGVLFIDEAYSLTPTPHGDGYEHEAIDTLMKLMEDLRQEVVVIVAGYPDLMAAFFDSNPGLSGRIATHLFFPDYDLDDLMAIFDGFCRDQGRICKPEARLLVRKLVDLIRAQPRFGNGRAVRNLFELLERRQAARLAPLGELATDEDLATFTIDDVPSAPVEQADGAYL